MRAFRIGGYNSAPAIEHVAIPVPNRSQVLVKVAAASLNPLDRKIQDRSVEAFFPVRFPYTLGTDIAGTIDRCGEDCGTFRFGERIVARIPPVDGGAIADYAVVGADQLVRLPDAIPFEQAAAIPTAAGTAWQALFEVGALRAGQSVLIHAGAGGVGSFAIQFARAAGARVIATASGTGLAIVEQLGADMVIDHREADFTDRVSDLDLVLDTIGGDTQARSYGVLRPGGILASLVSPPDAALAAARGITGAFVFHGSDASRLATVLDRVAAGVQVLTDRVAGLDDAAAAFERLASGRARGKIVIRT